MIEYTKKNKSVMSANILIVDDDPTILTALKKCLILFKQNPITAQSAEKALEILHTPDQNIDLVVTDLNLPNMTGLELAEVVISENPFIPILLITGYANLKSAQKAVSVGVYEYLTKPIDLPKFGVSIQQALEYRQLKLSHDEYQKDLEKKVIDRTQKLKKANDQLQMEIHEQKNLTKQLQEKNQMLESILTTSVDHIYMYDKDGKHMLASVSGAQSLGKNPEDFAGKSLQSIDIQTDVAECIESHRKKAAKTGKPQKFKTHYPTVESNKIFEYTFSPITINGDSGKSIAIARDTTKESHAVEFYESVQNASMDGIVLINKEGIILDTNHLCSQMFGYSKAELIGQHISILGVKESIEGINQHIQSIMKKGHDQFETQYKKNDGTILDIEVQCYYMKVQEQVCSFFHDITQKKKNQERLKEVNVLLSEAEGVANIGCWQWRVTDNSVLWSDNLYRLIGYQANEIQPDFDFWKTRVPLSDLAQYDDFIELAYKGCTNISSEYRFKRKDGALRHFVAKGRSYFDKNGKITHMIGIIMDITDQKQMEKQIETQRLKATQADRLHVLGEMAASIAHELNQPLSAISMIAEGICLRQEAGLEISQTQLRDYMTDELSLIDRMSDIINHMRVFARDTSEENPINFSVSQVIDSVLKFVKTQLKSHGIQIEVDVASNLPVCKGWPHELEQVLLNLISNARDALDAQSLKKQPNREPYLKILVDVCKQEKKIKIEISDNGQGIPEKVMNRIFEPFFTTKDVSKGTGLGLAISKSIIEKHQGSIDVKSVLEKGTNFVIHLPVASNSQTQRNIG